MLFWNTYVGEKYFCQRHDSRRILLFHINSATTKERKKSSRLSALITSFNFAKLALGTRSMYQNTLVTNSKKKNNNKKNKARFSRDIKDVLLSSSLATLHYRSVNIRAHLFTKSNAYVHNKIHTRFKRDLYFSSIFFIFQDRNFF